MFYYISATRGIAFASPFLLDGGRGKRSCKGLTVLPSIGLQVGSLVGDENTSVSFVNWLSTWCYGPLASPSWQESSATESNHPTDDPCATHGNVAI